MGDAAAASGTLNSSAPLAKVTKVPSVSTPVPSVHSARSGKARSSPRSEARSTPRSARESCGSHRQGAKTSSISGSSRRHRQQKIGGFHNAGQGNEDILVAARQVDAMINAIHSGNEGTQEYKDRVANAYKDLSKGQRLPSPGSDTSARRRSAVACRDDSGPAVGPVPAIVFSPRLSNSRDLHRLREASGKKDLPCKEVEPPWGPHRASMDRPPAERIISRQQRYCQMLDQQTADNSDQARIKTAQELQVNRTTNTSFETGHHKWGQETSDATRERAIFQELLATCDYRAKRERAGKEAERQDAVRMAEEMERQLAWQWHVRRAEDKQVKERLADVWFSAAKDKHKTLEAQKAAVLQEEKKVVEHNKQGMVPIRRIRRPKEECIAAQEMMPPRTR